MDTTREHSANRLHLRIRPTAEWKLRSGHPWLYEESIIEQNRDGQMGELAIIYDRYDNFLAIGLFDPTSPLRVRVLLVGKSQTINQDWWRAHFTAAIQRRDGLFDAQTTGYRCINGESDGCPGLVLDRYGSTLVLKLYTAAWLPWLAEITPIILERGFVRAGVAPNGFDKSEEASPPSEGGEERHNLQAGEERNAVRLVLRLSRNIQSLSRRDFSLTDGQLLHGPALKDAVIFRETGLQFEADVLRGQKTGFFLDQRENRRLVEALAQGRRVLNAFSFSGGFSLYAARGGATTVTDLDLSTHALESARRNFELNQWNSAVAGCSHEMIQADAFDWLRKRRKPEFDLIILDPPSLAKRETERSRAIQAYGKLADHASYCLRRGGVLVAASCSAHVSAAEFFEVIRESARKSGRKSEEIQTTGHPPDHPASFPEAQYLKCIYLRYD